MSKQPRFITRRLRFGDVPALLDLEKKQWTDEQAASADDFRQRIREHPELCSGAFRVDSGELVASLFCRPTACSEWTQLADWATKTRWTSHGKTDALFGISLTSIDSAGALQLIAFQYLDSIKKGRRYAYLGSPMPGLRRHLQRQPQACVETYARATRSGLPIDPQLRYYHGKGFQEIVGVVENYFPHEASCNYGVILRTKVPYMWLRPFVALFPEPALRLVASIAPRLLIPNEKERKLTVQPQS